MPSLKQVVEALVFASQKPLVPREIAGALKAAADESDDAEVKALGKSKEAEIGQALEELKGEIDQAERSFRLVEQVNGWHFVTKGECAPWVRQLFPESKPVRLSGPALETLAIISYRQPITRADIEAVRGVAVDGMVNMLLERQLIRIAGRSEAPGRPLLYETTEHFLVHFGLKTLDELPNASELRRIELPTAPKPVEEEKPQGDLPLAAEEPADEAAAETVAEPAGDPADELAETAEEAGANAAAGPEEEENA